MDPITLVLVLTFAITFVLLLMKNIGESMIATWRGTTPPRIARKEARQKLRVQYGAPTIAEAFAARVSHRIEHPPQRRWAAKLREVLTEIVEDALSEAQVRHQRAHAARQRRDRGWQARTGGPSQPAPPRPEPANEPDDALPCRCGNAYVVPPDTTCDDCDPAGTPPDDDPDTEPIPPVPPDPTNTDHDTDRKEPQMGTQDHNISADVRDPLTALSYADSCRGFNDAIVDQLDLAAARLTDAKVGQEVIAVVRRMQDAGRTYSASNADLAHEYAEYVAVQEEIRSDEHLRDTVQGTFLDPEGGARTAAYQAGAAKVTINGADCRTPRAGRELMDNVNAAYQAMKRGADQVKGNHQTQGVAGRSLECLSAQVELATWMAGQAEQAAATFTRHMTKRDDTIGRKQEALGGTQDGHYLTSAGR